MNKNIQIPQQKISIAQAVSALMNFMKGQIKFNKDVRDDLAYINEELYEPVMRDKQNIRCVSAFM